MKSCEHSIDRLLAIARPMVLLDEVVGYDERSLIASLTITEQSMFVTGSGVPSHIGLEYMAQACGAYAGAVALDRDQPVKIGFLLGTRQFRADVPWFPLRQRLTIHVTALYCEEGMATFDCMIRMGDVPVAAAPLTLYQPDDPIRFIGESAQ
jgi:predicted hotdog family 3-hydroxylacyl-ACP dehydratase